MVATPASTALPPAPSMRIPASTSKLLVEPTISCRPRTGGNMVSLLCALKAAAAVRTKPAILGPIAIHGLRDRRAAHLDTLQVGGSDPVLFGQQQRVVTGAEGRRSPRRTRIVAHHRGGNSVSRYGVQPGQQHSRLHPVDAFDPRSLA